MTRPVSAGASWRRTDSTSGSSGMGRTVLPVTRRPAARAGGRPSPRSLLDTTDRVRTISTQPSPQQRDRDERGRPEQARPRDRTGRPLPYDTDVTERTEEHEYATVDEALQTGVRLWGAHRFFEAHECLEDVWHQAGEPDREFWKGVIQVAVGCVHHQRGNADGCVTLLRRAADYLDPYPAEHHGIDTARLRDDARSMAAVIEDAGATVPHDYPTFPAVDDGPYVGEGPDEGPFPLRDEPAWRTPPRGTQE